MDSIQSMLKRIDRQKALIGDRRPLDPAEAKELHEYYKIGLTYTSNAIEGNTYDLTETKVLLEDGLTAHGKPMKDALETIGHGEAYDFMLSVAEQKVLNVSEETICKLHGIFYNRIDADNAGRYRQRNVFITGTDYVPPKHREVPELMLEFVRDLNKRAAKLHPILLAAYAHRRLVDIHPFVDGNGRTARLLMNLILINKGYQVVSIPPVLRVEYIRALQEVQRENNPSDDAFNELIASCEFETQEEIMRRLHIKPPEKAQSER
ncbi:MAG: Fic family protein [Christensenella sp.]